MLDSKWMETMTRDLTKLTRPEVDELFVAAWQRRDKAHHTMAHLEEWERENDMPLSPYQEAEHAKAVRDFTAALAELEPLDAEWNRTGGWTRYWLVTNHDGHVHRTMACPTTFPTTQWAFVTSLSGLTEDEMVEQVGHQACTVCFPQAPTLPAFIASLAKAEAEEQAKRDGLCSGSGTYNHDSSGLRYASPRANCKVCGRTVSVTSTGKMRNHKTPDQERAEAQAEAKADPKKILDTDGQPLRGRWGDIKTVVSAWRELVSDMDSLRYYVREGGDDYRESIARITAALAAKLDTTVEDITEQAEKKLAAKKKREARG